MARSRKTAPPRKTALPRRLPVAAAPVAARPLPEPYLRIAIAVALFVTALRLMYLASGAIDLYPDEAQYWVWAQTPAWGYYSKPPMVAWIIAATCAVGGDNELAVRAGAPLIYAATSLVVYAIARRLYDGRTAAWSAIAFVTLPAVSLSSFIISTDVPLLLFWGLATFGIVRAREDGGKWWWLLVGVAGGLGLLAKFAMGFWIGSALLFLAIKRGERRHLRPFLRAALLSFAIYAPNLAWNAAHHFASYAHTRDNANISGLAIHPLDFAEFVGSQLGVFGPVFFVTLIVYAVSMWRGRLALVPGDTLLLALALPTLGIMCGEAALSRAHPNWSAPTYLTATIFVVALLMRLRRESWVQWSVVLHVVLVLVVLSAADIGRAIGHPLSGALDPLHRLKGWHGLGRAVSQRRIEEGLPRLLFDDRELMSAMMFYIEPHPLDALMWHEPGPPRSQFEMAAALPDEPGGDYLWVTTRKDRAEVTDRFQQSEEAYHIIVPLGPGLAREIWLFRLQGFKGYAVHGD